MIKIEAPTTCPFCGAKIVRFIENGAHLYCSNPDCSEKKLQQLNYFVTKQCMNIDGLSEKTLRKLQSTGKVNEWKDLYELTFDDYCSLGLGDKTAAKLVKELQKSREEVPAENVLMALGIPMIGKVTAQKLIEHYKSIKNIEQTSFEDIAKIESIGEVAALYIYDFMQKNKVELQNVYKYLQYESKSSSVSQASNKLDGMTILATGTLKNFTRDSIKESIISNGGKYASGVSAKLSFLLVGDAPGASKINKAASLGIKTIDEDEYLKMIS